MVTVRGGAAFSETLGGLAAKLAGKKVLKVGFLEGATYPSGDVTNLAGKTKKSEPVSVATVAATQEFGSPEKGIPPRPYFRNMIAAKKDEWGPAADLQLRKTDFDIDKTLEIIGLGIKGQLQQSIIDTNAPPLAPQTVARKGFDKPLIDTGHMIRSVDYEVSE